MQSKFDKKKLTSHHPLSMLLPLSSSSSRPSSLKKCQILNHKTNKFIYEHFCLEFQVSVRYTIQLECGLCLLVDNNLLSCISRESFEMSHHAQFSILSIIGFCHSFEINLSSTANSLKYLWSICNFQTNIRENEWNSFFFFKWILCSLNAIEYANWTKYGVWCRFIIILWYLRSRVCLYVSACSIFQSHYFDAFARNKTHRIEMQRHRKATTIKKKQMYP